MQSRHIRAFSNTEPSHSTNVGKIDERKRGREERERGRETSSLSVSVYGQHFASESS
jgi:hypothetical protein